MPTPRRVVLYGNSVFLAGIAVHCSDHPELEIVMIDADDRDAAQRLHALSPDVIVFDWPAAPLDGAISLLKKRPDLKLIGIDPNSDQLLLWSAQRSRALTMQDLVQAIQ